MHFCPRPPQVLLFQWIGWLGLFLFMVACAKVFDLPDAIPAPRITAIIPDSGAVNTPVTITGINFSPEIKGNVVKFNGKEAQITVATATKLTALVPDNAGSGNIEVVVKSKATEGPLFTYLQTPLIIDISPREGKTSTVVTIHGKYFDTTAVNNIVRFAGKIAAITPPARDTLLRAVVPADAPTGEVSVTVKGITGIGPRFTVLGTSDGPTHTITAISPARGTAGTVVTITGLNFNTTPANNVVKFNGVTAQVTAATATLITAIAPQGGSTGLVSLTINNATVNGPTFTYVADTPVPAITNLDPGRGPAGITVAIVGTNFSPDIPGNIVKFNGKIAVVTGASATLLKATVPEGAGTGLVTVTVNEKTSNGFIFTYLDNAPTIIDFTPKTGPAGTIVRISGTNFGNNNAAIVVKFNGVTTPVQEGDGGTSLTVAMPQGATTGRITITINNLTATSAVDFIVTNTSPGTVTVTGNLNYGRFSHTATLLSDGRVLVAGGSGSEQTNPPCEIYDPATGTWTLTGNLKTHRTEHQAFLLRNGKVLVIGGTNPVNRSVANVCELFDPATGQWTETVSLSILGTIGNNAVYRSSGFRAIMLADGRILATGGGTYLQGNDNGFKAEVYDQATGTWTLTGEMFAGDRILHTNTLLKNGSVLVAGGNTFSTVYNPASNSWATTGSTLDTLRSLPSAVLLPNDKVLLIGGAYSNGVLASCLLYDPGSGQWSTTGSMNKERARTQSVLLKNGKVLAVGGQDGNQNQVVGLLELYDPLSGKWTPSGAIQTPRNAHTITLLPNGQVLIAGGINYRGAGYNSCEIYTP